MEPPPVYVYCDWTFFDAVGRFIMLSLWGYAMGSSITTSARATWCLTFGGVLAIALIHAGMQPEGSIGYFIKVFLFYLTAAVIGYRPGRQKAEKTKAELNRMQDALNRWEAREENKTDPKEN